jgi:hypothetical protein
LAIATGELWSAAVLTPLSLFRVCFFFRRRKKERKKAASNPPHSKAR